MKAFAQPAFAKQACTFNFLQTDAMTLLGGHSQMMGE